MTFNNTTSILPIRGIVFDMDGVLVDSEALINEAAVQMFRELGINVKPEEFYPFIGCGEDKYISGVAELHGISIDLDRAKRRTYEIYLSLVPQKLKAFEGAVKLVRLCKAKGFKIALASSADKIKIEANLKKIGLPLKHWDAVVSSEDVLYKKPHPDIFLKAASLLGLLPVNCVVVEDSVVGIEAAKKAGMRVVAVAHTFKPQQLALADVVKHTIGDVTLEDLHGGRVFKARH